MPRRNMVHVPGDCGKLSLVASRVSDQFFPRPTSNTAPVEDGLSVVGTSTSPVFSRGSQDAAWVSPGFRLRFRCSKRHTAVQTSKRVSARISSVAWNTRRLLINDWHAVLRRGYSIPKPYHPAASPARSAEAETRTQTCGTGRAFGCAMLPRPVLFLSDVSLWKIDRASGGGLPVCHPKAHACSCGCYALP
jgi:hypothetical protein